MFTGLIETMGTVISVERQRGSCTIGIRPDEPGFDTVPGASVAVSGVCLTVEGIKNAALFFTAVKETLLRTTLNNACPGGRVNLERPLRADGRFDGHMVLGHVDGTGTIAGDRPEGAGRIWRVKVPESIAPLMAEKGSIAIDGVSLTISRIAGNEVTLSLIPKTLEATSLSLKRAGDPVNVEADVFARYLHAMLETSGFKLTAPGEGRDRSMGATLFDRMERAGF